MKLTKFLYDFLIKDEYNWDLEEPSDYPFEINEEDYKDVLEDKWGGKRYITLDYKADKWVMEHDIQVMSEEITDYDLEKAYVTKRMVFKLDNHYYAFEYNYSYYWDDEDIIDNELQEVHPVEKTITVYE